MLKPEEISEIKRLVDVIFEAGPNKKGTVDAIVNYVDQNYVYQYGAFKDLINDINRVGNYQQWRRNLINQMK